MPKVLVCVCYKFFHKMLGPRLPICCDCIIPEKNYRELWFCYLSPSPILAEHLKIPQMRLILNPSLYDCWKYKALHLAVNKKEQPPLLTHQSLVEILDSKYMEIPQLSKSWKMSKPPEKGPTPTGIFKKRWEKQLMYLHRIFQ